MHCVYYPNLQINNDYITISGQEYYHLRSLRLKIGENVIITNGNGLSAITSLYQIGIKKYEFCRLEYIENMNENPYQIGLAMAILDNNERFENALEKAVELGVTDFYPIITKNTQKKSINYDRLIAKAISALKQCKRSKLIKIHSEIELLSFLQDICNWENVIVADLTGEKPSHFKKSNCLIIIGPEGGFAEEELYEFNRHKSINVWKINQRTLRSETAAIATLSLVTHFLDT